MSDATKPTRPNEQTKSTEDEDALVPPRADRMPTPDEEAAAERAGDVDPEVAERYEDAIERGARQPGEGRIP